MTSACLRTCYTVTTAPFAGKDLTNRKNIRKHSNCYSRSIQDTIKRLVDISKDQSIKDCYESRLKEYSEWLALKNVKEIVLNQKIDVRDTEDIWCIGIVMQIHRNSNHAHTLLIHYQGKFNLSIVFHGLYYSR